MPLLSRALPLPLTSFIGRERELAAATRHVLHPAVRLVTLIGAGGIGKTRLALGVAEHVQPAFAHGVCFVDLTPVDQVDLVLPAIAGALGLRETADQSLEASLQDYLADRRILLVLDNVEQVVDAAPRIATLLANCGGLKVLATSRIALRLSGEQLFVVPPLALPDLACLPDPADLGCVEAVDLFVQRALNSNSDLVITTALVRDVAEICIRLDGLPLAIELAAARTSLLPPHALLARLTGPADPLRSCTDAHGETLDLLTGGPRDQHARQRTLRATIAWSHALLDGLEQRLFRRLAVFVGGCTLADAQTVCGTMGDPAPVLLDGLESLLHKSLLLQRKDMLGESRLLLLQTIRDYALEQLAAGEDALAVGQAHARCFLAFARMAATQIAGPRQKYWLDRLEVEHENLRAALAWALEHRDAETALGLGSALWRFWQLRGRLTEGRRWLEEALALETGVDMAAVRARALSGAGVLAHYQGEYGRAATLCGESLLLARRLGDAAETGRALLGLAMVAVVGRHYATAGAMYEEALTLLGQAGDRWGVAFTRARLAGTLWWRGEFVAARPQMERALAEFRDLGDRQGAAMALVGLGYLARAENNLPAAHTFFEESLVILRDLDDRYGLPRALLGLGSVLARDGEYRAARTRLEEALTLFADVGETLYVIRCRIGLALLVQMEGQPDSLASRRQADEALQVLEEQAMAAISAMDMALLSRLPIGPPIAEAESRRIVALPADPEHRQQGPRAITRHDRALRHTGVLRDHLGGTSPDAAPARRRAVPAANELTAREVEVLRLVSLGLSDYQVATHLQVSRRTVNSHLSSIYSKLNVTSRTAAARVAATHALV